MIIVARARYGERKAIVEAAFAELSPPKPFDRRRSSECAVRLLLIEDEARIAEILEGALKKAGFVVDTLSSCADAREALSLYPYDIAIIDRGLPDGVQAADAILHDKNGNLIAGGSDFVEKFHSIALYRRIRVHAGTI